MKPFSELPFPKVSLHYGDRVRNVVVCSFEPSHGWDVRKTYCSCQYICGKHCHVAHK